jgi:PAS domain S-box-containing protein
MTYQRDNHAHPEGNQMSTDPLLLPQAAGAKPALPLVTAAESATLLDFSPDALILVDPAGKMVLVNSLASSLFGYHAEELAGQPLEMLLPERFRAAHRVHRTSYAATPRQRPMGVGRRKDGSEFPVDISLRSILSGGTSHSHPRQPGTYASSAKLGDDARRASWGNRSAISGDDPPAVSCARIMRRLPASVEPGRGYIFRAHS